MKTCSKCKVEKELSEFNKDRRARNGLQSKCKSCEKEYSEANKERIKERKKEYYKSNKERINESRKEYYQANKEYFKKYREEWYQTNKEKLKERYKEYRQANKERKKEIDKKYRQDNKERINEYRRNRKQTDPLFKMRCNLASRTSKVFKRQGYRKTSKTQEMLGVDWEVCKAHIERQFTKGMNWDNQGEWHIDHIIPLASANNEVELKKLCHYTNLQPLWAEENLSKSDKITGQQNRLRL